jgi:hypothetical protein
MSESGSFTRDMELELANERGALDMPRGSINKKTCRRNPLCCFPVRHPAVVYSFGTTSTGFPHNSIKKAESV